MIKNQFIERDLFNATDISQAKWKIYGQKYELNTFKKHLEGNRKIIEDMFENRPMPKLDGNQIKTVDELINKLSDEKLYKKIFI